MQTSDTVRTGRDCCDDSSPNPRRFSCRRKQCGPLGTDPDDRYCFAVECGFVDGHEAMGILL
jgi:hypothetical protein